jgi:hypothetical protein
MKLPYLEDIYDLETCDLENILEEIKLNLEQKTIGDGFETYEKYERKASDILPSIEMELEERKKVDDVVNFFLNINMNDLNMDSESLSTADSGTPSLLENEELKQNELKTKPLEKNITQKKSVKQHFNPFLPPSNLEEELEAPKLEDASNKEEKKISKIEKEEAWSMRSMSGLGIGGGAARGNQRNKRQLQEFMKAKLSQTKQEDTHTLLIGRGQKRKPTPVKKESQNKKKQQLNTNITNSSIKKQSSTKLSSNSNSSATKAHNTEEFDKTTSTCLKDNTNSKKEIKKPPLPKGESSSRKSFTKSDTGTVKTETNVAKQAVNKMNKLNKEEDIKKTGESSLNKALNKESEIAEAPQQTKQTRGNKKDGKIESVSVNTLQSQDQVQVEIKNKTCELDKDKSNTGNNDSKSISSMKEEGVGDQVVDLNLASNKENMVKRIESPDVLEEVEERIVQETQIQPSNFKTLPDSSTQIAEEIQDLTLIQTEKKVEVKEIGLDGSEVDEDLAEDEEEMHKERVKAKEAEEEVEIEEELELEEENKDSKEEDQTQDKSEEETSSKSTLSQSISTPLKKAKKEEAYRNKNVEKMSKELKRIENTCKHILEQKPAQPSLKKAFNSETLSSSSCQTTKTSKTHKTGEIGCGCVKVKSSESVDGNKTLNTKTPAYSNIEIKGKVSGGVDGELNVCSDKQRSGAALHKNTNITNNYNSSIGISENGNGNVKESRGNPTNSVLPKTKKKNGELVRLQKELDSFVVDYSNHYKTFSDIFSGYAVASKRFDIVNALTETHGIYRMFNNLMDNNTLFSFEFTRAPLEQAMDDYMHYSQIPNHYIIANKKFQDLQLQIKNKDNETMIQALCHKQLQEKFKKISEIRSAADENDTSTNNYLKNFQTDLKNLIDPNKKSQLFYRVVRSRSEVYDIVTRAFSRKRRWTEMPHGLNLKHTWNFLWSWSKSKIDLDKLLVWQKLNHFPQSKNLTRKDYLKKHLERFQKMGQKSSNIFNILPTTYVLPKEYIQFVEDFSQAENEDGQYNYWIMKPCAKSRGRGISVFNSISDVTYGDPIIVQKYIRNPLLLNGFKFDLRIYVLVTSFNPLEAFIYKDGFARVSTVPFSLDPHKLENKFIHLTNSSIQQYSSHTPDSTDSIYGGTKISLETLIERLKHRGINFGPLWKQLVEICTKSLICCQVHIPYNPSCFELFGYDIIFDQNLKAWLIEVNASPSLSRMNLLDDLVKQRLIDDTIDLINPIDYDRKRLQDVLHRRLHENMKNNSFFSNNPVRDLNRDLMYILNGNKPRIYGQIPDLLGNYERIAPSPFSEKILKLVGGQKMFAKKIHS